MRIGELVHRSGLSMDTIRYYERLNLLKRVASATDPTDAKEYPAENLERLKWIDRLKEMGFSLSETAAMLELMECGERPSSLAKERLEEKLSLIDSKIRQLMKMKETIQSFID
ncbi:MerR family DNA-binding protein [Pontibacter sp. G13]|uniref:MerR family DNA-binding protein n=1 Tax=Pontibacter sp. G13 TaxID=3074898 RepID=UPI00288A0AFB|nr:MerR family DNA-binding protein [Pontibacter sp. G13]WNJ19452.1 MerR family DNA-binding protein [Pontibacter sp. G13]